MSEPMPDDPYWDALADRVHAARQRTAEIDALHDAGAISRDERLRLITEMHGGEF